MKKNSRFLRFSVSRFTIHPAIKIILSFQQKSYSRNFNCIQIFSKYQIFKGKINLLFLHLNLHKFVGKRLELKFKIRESFSMRIPEIYELKDSKFDQLTVAEFFFPWELSCYFNSSLCFLFTGICDKVQNFYSFVDFPFPQEYLIQYPQNVYVYLPEYFFSYSTFLCKNFEKKW